EFTGGLLLDVNVDDDAIGRRARFRRHLDGLEEVEVLQALFRAVHQGTVVGVAFDEVELAPDHIVARAGVAANIDAFDVGARAFLDHQHDADGVGLKLAVAARAHDGERIAAPGDFDRDVFNGFLHRVGVVNIAGPEPQPRTQCVGVHGRDIGYDVDRSNLVARPFLDRERNVEASGGRVVFGQRRDDANVGKAVLQIEPAQQIAVGLDTIRIEVVVALDPTQPIGLTALDHVLQAPIAVGVVADEGDLVDAGLASLVDLEDQVDAVIG